MTCGVHRDSDEGWRGVAVMWTVSDTRSAHAKGATEAEAELASQHLAVVEDGKILGGNEETR